MTPAIPEAVQAYLSSYPYKIELHAHTAPASACGKIPPAELIERLHAKGVSGVVITNHFYRGARFWDSENPIKTYLSDYQAAKEAGEAYGMSVLLGAEFRFTENNNDYLIYGVDEEFLCEASAHLDMAYEDFYDKYHSSDRLFIQAHPFRNGMVRIDSAHTDGAEIFNMHPNQNSRIGLAGVWAKENGQSILTLGTDLHDPDHEGICATRTRILPRTSAELIAILKSRDYLMDIAGCPVLPYAQF